jgi:hypothetical protein
MLLDLETGAVKDVDEISFASSSDILNLHEKLTQLKELAGQKYDGLHVIFTGDFSQLEPVNGTPLYNEPNFAHWHEVLHGNFRNVCRNNK